MARSTPRSASNPSAPNAPKTASSAVEARARRQHGVISRSDAIAAGMSKAQVDRRLRRGRWVSSPVRSVYLIAEFGDDPVAHLAAATRFPGALAHRRSTLALWGLVDHPAKPHIVLARSLHSPAINVTVQRSLVALPRRRRVGIPTVSLEFGLASLAATEPATTLHRLIDEALRRQLTTQERVMDALRDTANITRRGSAVLRSILAERDPAAVVPLSDWSRDVADRLEASGLHRPEMEWQVRHPAGHLVAQVDLAYPSARYAIELDSIAFHLDREAFERDRRRDIDLSDLGWHVDRFTWAMCTTDWPWVVSTVSTRLRRSGAQCRPHARGSAR